jgi:hypothetical protein
MSFDDNNFDDLGDAQLPEESNNNRTFLVAIGILGGIILISVACLGGFLLFNSRNAGAAQSVQATANANGTSSALAVINQALTSTFQASILPTDTPTSLPTSTPPVGVPSETRTPDPALLAAIDPGTPAAATATVGAALTQAAAAQLTIVATTTALPRTGIADEYGLPGLVVMALAFVIVILLARRLRVAPTTNR